MTTHLPPPPSTQIRHVFLRRLFSAEENHPGILIIISVNVLRIEICFLLSFRLGTSSLLQNISYLHICTMFKFRAVAIR